MIHSIAFQSSNKLSDETGSNWERIGDLSPVADAVSGHRDAQKSDVSAECALGNKVFYFDKANPETLKVPAKSRKLRRFQLKQVSAALLLTADPKLSNRVHTCCKVAWDTNVELKVQRAANGSLRGSFHGVFSCSSPWACPCCSQRLSSLRCREMNHLLAYARGAGLEVALLTFTARHTSRTKLAPQLKGMRKAMGGVRASRSWRGLGKLKTVSSLEVTHGLNGWHPHIHLIVVMPKGASISGLEALRSEWLKQLGKLGLSGGKAAFDLRSGNEAGAYISKFGLAEEVALNGEKSPRLEGSRTPWQILEDASEGCIKSKALWIEYNLALKGSRQLVWSNHLKAEIDLAAKMQAENEEAQAQLEHVGGKFWDAATPAWRAASLRVGSILSAVEEQRCFEAAEFGPTDHTQWMEERQDAVLIERENL